MTTEIAAIDVEAAGANFNCSGPWVVTSVHRLIKNLPHLIKLAATQVTVDAEGIGQFDTAGAWLLYQFCLQLEQSNKEVNLVGLTPEHQTIYQLIIQQSQKIPPMKPWRPPNWLYHLGKSTVGKVTQLWDYSAFLGEFILELGHCIRRPWHFQWQGFLGIIEQAGYRAMPIIALLQFLIGLVIAYQVGLQLKLYGATIYVVGLSGVAVFQEFGPLITAIIVAGRTGAAFTAQLGSMKINQEIDALLTMGISPMRRLVLPRWLGLTTSLPLLTIWADVFGIMGAMLISQYALNVSYHEFWVYLPVDTAFKNYLIGMCKTPVFATIIAMVGCFQGFQVSYSADSVGERTTKCVVQSIFLIIIADAAFAVLFGW